MKIKSLIATTLVALSVASGVAQAENLRVGSLGTYAPFDYFDAKEQKFVGFDMDLLAAVAKKAGFTYSQSSFTLDGLIPALQAGNIDIAVSAFSITPKRLQRVDFTDPYYDGGLTVMVRQSNKDKITSSKDLEGKVLCAEIGSSGAQYMQQIPGATVRNFNSAPEAFIELSNGGCYAMVNDKPVNEYFLAQPSSEALKLKEEPVMLESDKYGFAVKKGNKALLTRLNKAFAEIRADGTYAKIYKKWFGESPLEK